MRPIAISAEKTGIVSKNRYENKIIKTWAWPSWRDNLLSWVDIQLNI